MPRDAWRVEGSHWEVGSRLRRGQVMQAGVHLGRASRKGAEACCWRGTRQLGACLWDRGQAGGAGRRRPPASADFARSPFLLLPITRQILQAAFQSCASVLQSTSGQGPGPAVSVTRMSHSVCPLRAQWPAGTPSRPPMIDRAFSFRHMSFLGEHFTVWCGQYLSRDYPLCGRQNSPRSPRLPTTPRDSSPAGSLGLGLWLDFSVTGPLQGTVSFKGGGWSGRAGLMQDPFRGPSCRQLPTRPASQSSCT